MAQRHVLKRTADVLAFWNRQGRAEQDRRHHARLHGLAVDLAANQLGEDERALRMGDEHKPTASVLVFQIVVPRIAYIVVLNALLERRPAAAGESAAKSGERDLSVEGGEGPADGAEPRKLLADDVALGRVCDHVAIRRRI